MGYKDEIIKSMDWLAAKNDTIFIGQSVSYSGNAIYNTLKSVPENRWKGIVPACVGKA